MSDSAAASMSDSDTPSNVVYGARLPPLTVLLAVEDLHRHLTTMDIGAAVDIKICIAGTPVKDWDPWIKEKLLASENALYWEALFENPQTPHSLLPKRHNHVVCTEPAHH